MAKFSNPALVQRLLDELAPTVKKDAQTGRVGFEGWGYDLVSDLVIDLSLGLDDVPVERARSIVKSSLFKVADPDGFTVQALQAAISAGRRAYLKQPIQRLVLVTSVSAHWADPLRRSQFGDAYLSFPGRLPSGFAEARAQAMDQAEDRLLGPPPSDYRWARVSVAGRCEDSITRRALDALQLQLALWNFVANRRKGTRISMGRRNPVNEIVWGPVHTLHLKDGSLAKDLWWWEPDYVVPHRVKWRRDEMERLQDKGRKIRELMRRVGYRDRIEVWLRQYNRALDERDLSTSFIRLWQVLEAVTDTGREPYKVTLRRAGFLYHDHEYHSAVLGKLRDSRNALVHHGEEPASGERKLFALKGYVENLLVFHWVHGSQFDSLAHATEFLDLPHDHAERRRMRSLLETAERIRD